MERMELSPHDRVRTVLRGEQADRVPFTIYWLMLPRGDAARQLRNEGVTIVERVPLYNIVTPNVETITREYYKDGEHILRKELKTTSGEIYSTYKKEQMYGTSWWQVDYYIKKPEDYRVLEFYIKDMIYKPCFQSFVSTQEQYGEDGYVIGNTEYTPMNMLIYKWLGIERFSIDLVENTDQLISIYELHRNKQRDMFKLCSESPAELIIYGGNISKEVVGLDRFKQYYLPCLNEFADCIHGQDKLAGCHMDAMMDSLVDSVAGSNIDVVEAFTPVPTCDVTIAEARDAWKDKILWINFPSSVHIESDERICRELLTILQEASPGDRFLIGITEDVPKENWRRSFHTINRILRDKGKLPLKV